MTKQVIHRCVGCGREYPHAWRPFCECGHFIDVFYDLKRATLHASPDPYIRFFDVLPVEREENLIPNRHGMTACRHAEALGRRLGIPRLFLKDETTLPTGTTKDRMATVALSYMRELGIRVFTTSSTGNSCTAYAHGLRACPEVRSYFFVGEAFLDRLQADTSLNNVVVYAFRGATFVEASDMSVEFANRNGLVAERGFFNPGRREGLKLAFMEAAEQIPQPIDWYVQAVSSAMGVYGTYKGAKELHSLGRISRLPRLLCVQQETNPPMVSAFKAGSPVIRPQDIVRHPQGIAYAILRGDPSRVYPYVHAAVSESRGTFAAVSEQEIRDARKLVEDIEGVSPCFTASTAVAGLARVAREGGIPAGDTVLVNLTGSDRKPVPPQAVRWVRRTDAGWKLEDPARAGAKHWWEDPDLAAAGGGAH